MKPYNDFEDDETQLLYPDYYHLSHKLKGMRTRGMKHKSKKVTEEAWRLKRKNQQI